MFSGTTTTINGSSTFNGAYTHDNITLASGSTLTLGAATNVAGNWTNNSGTGALTGNYILTKSGTGKTIGGTYATTFYGLTLAASSTTTLNTDATVGAADLIFTASGAAQSLTHNDSSVDLTVTGKVTMNQPTGAFTSAWNINAGTAAVTGVVALAGTTSTATWISTVVITSGSLTTSANITFAAVTTPASKVVTVGAGTITITTAQTLATGTMTITSTGLIDFQAGLALTTSATAAVFTQFSGATVKFGGNFSSATTAYVFTAGSTEEFDANSTITPTTAITFANLKITAGTVTLAGVITVAGNWTNNSSATALTGNYVVTMNGASKVINGTYLTPFYGLTIASAAAAAATITMNTAASVGAGNFTITPGAYATTFTHGSGIVLTVTGTATINQPTAAVTSAWNINTGSAVVTGTVTIAGTTATANYINKIVLTTGTLEMNAATSLTIGGAIVANHIIDTSGGAAVVKIAGTNTNAANATSIPGTASTWVFDGTAAGQSIPVSWGTAAAYANIQILNTNAAGAYPAGAITATNVTGNITVGDDSSTAAIMKNGSVNIAGNAGKAFIVKNAATFQMDGTTQVFPTVFGTFTFGASSTTIYNQTSAQNIYNVASPGYGNLTFTPVGTPTYTGQSGTLYIQGNLTVGTGANAMIFTNSGNDPTIDVNGNVTITATATLIASDLNTMSVGGDWLNSGTFTANSNTVTLDGADSSTQTLSGNTTFYNFTASTASNTAGRTIKFTDGSTTTVTGTWTITGFSGKVITLTRTVTTSAWTINPTAASVTYVNVSWSTNIGVSFCATYSTNGGNNTGWSISGGASCNTAPNAPTALVQKKVTGGTTLNTGDWTNETQVQFTASATDPDASDTLYLCVEKDTLGTAFSSTNGGDLCGTGVAYSGTAVTVTVTITGLTDATEYHWQAQVKDAANAYSGWVSYGGNLETERDFGIDTTAPTGGSVYDGTSGDQDWNDGSLTSLSANWTGFDATVSGLNKYEYAVRRSSDSWYWNTTGPTWQLGAVWYDNGAGTTVTVTPIYLNTGENYYFSVRATDNASNTASPVDSNGQQISPTLSFSLSGNTVTFADLNNTNSWTDTQTSTTTTSTNASSGYTAKAYITQLLTSLAYPTVTIANFYGTWANPEPWPSGTYGFGYTSNDTNVQGSNRFNSGTEFAGFSQTASGDVVADHTAAVNGQTGAVSGEEFIITYKVAVSNTQAATTYQTYVTYIVTANY